MAGNTWNAINSQVPYQLLGGSGSGPIPPHEHGVSQTFSFGRYRTAFSLSPANVTTYLGSSGMGSILGFWNTAAMGVPVSIIAGDVLEIEFYRDSYDPPVLLPGMDNPTLTLAKANFQGVPGGNVTVNITLPGDNVEKFVLPNPFSIAETDYLSMSLSSRGRFNYPAVRFVVKEV